MSTGSAVTDKEQVEARATGWAVVVESGLLVATVSPTRRAAIVNWLVVRMCIRIPASLCDDDIDRLWDFYRKPDGAQVIEVSIASLKSPEGEVLDSEVIVSLLRKHFNDRYFKNLTCTRWKDGIDIDHPTYAIEEFVKDVAARAILSRLSRPATAPEWQPIETAPKLEGDDNELLGIWLDSRGDQILVFIHYDPSNEHSNHGFIGRHGECYGAGGITHWRHKPALPAIPASPSPSKAEAQS